MHMLNLDPEIVVVNLSAIPLRSRLHLLMNLGTPIGICWNFLHVVKGRMSKRSICMRITALNLPVVYDLY